MERNTQNILNDPHNKAKMLMQQVLMGLQEYVKTVTLTPAGPNDPIPTIDNILLSVNKKPISIKDYMNKNFVDSVGVLDTITYFPAYMNLY